MIHTASPYVLCQCGEVHRESVAPDLAYQLRPYRSLFLTNTTKHSMLDALGALALYGSLHTAYSSTGTNELPTSATLPASLYGRVALTWAAAGAALAGAKDLTTVLPTWNVPATFTVMWWGMWNQLASGGTFYGMLPTGAGTLRPCSVENTTDRGNSEIFSVAHGYVAGDRVVFWGTNIPSALTGGTGHDVFYVTSSGGGTPTANSFKVSTGGPTSSPVDLSAITVPANFFVQRCVPEQFTGAGSYSLASGRLDLSAVA